MHSCIYAYQPSVSGRAACCAQAMLPAKRMLLAMAATVKIAMGNSQRWAFIAKQLHCGIGFYEYGTVLSFDWGTPVHYIVIALE